MYLSTDYTTLIPWALATTVATMGLLVAERYGLVRLRAAFKTVAAFSFFGAALAHSPTNSSFSLWVSVGLASSVVGDLCLLQRGTGRVFTIGVGAFLVAHLAYTTAFIKLGVDWWFSGIFFVTILVPFGIKLIDWLLVDIPPKLEKPILVYTLVISVMMALSIGVWAEHRDLGFIPLAACLFLISDVGVAIQRFKTPLFAHKVWSIPAYFIAQLLFAMHTLLPI